MNEASPDVACTFVFPKTSDLKLETGEIAEILIGFHNKGDRTFNVTEITASLRHPQDFNYYIQNFTKGYYQYSIGPGERVSMSYYFYPDVLEARTFGLTANVHYVDENDYGFTSTFFNATVDIIEPESSIDSQTFFTYFGILTLIGFASIIVYRFSISRKKKARRHMEHGTKHTVDVADDEWLVGTSVHANANPGSRGKKAKQH